MASGEDALRGEISELREKIAAIKEEVTYLRKQRNAYIAKLKLLENHLNAYYLNDGTKDTEHGDSSDESFTTSELLQLSFSSISSSVLGSTASLYDDSDKDDSNDVESGKHAGT